MSKKRPRLKNKPTHFYARKTREPHARSKSISLPLSLIFVALTIGICFFLFVKVNPPELTATDVDFAIEDAIEAARQQVISSPRSGAAWGKLGMVFLAHGFSGQAEESLVKAHQLDRKNPMWLYLHARAIDEKQPKRAIELLNQAVELAGNRPEVIRLSLVELLLTEQRLDEADHHLQEFLEQDQNNVRATHSLARLYFMRNEFQKCKDTIINMHHDIRNRYQVQQQRAKSLAQQGKRNDASMQIKQANQQLTLDLCKQRTIGELLANAMRRLGETESAAKQLKLAEGHPDRNWADPYTKQVVELRTGLKQLLVQSDRAFGAGDHEKSISILESAIKSYPESMFAYVHLGRAHIRLGRTAYSQQQTKKSKEHYRLALTHLERALELDSNSVEALFRLGVAYVDLADIDGDESKFEAAEKVYRRAIEIKPDFTMAYYNLSNSLDRQGKLSEAIEALKNVIRLEPERGEACYRLGTLLVRAGELTDAENNLRKAIQLDPKNDAARAELRKLEAAKPSS